MRIFVFTIALLILTSFSAVAEEVNSGFGESFFAETGHPGFDDPLLNVSAEDLAAIEPSAGSGEEETSDETADIQDNHPEADSDSR